jgi:hypothetical protein
MAPIIVLGTRKRHCCCYRATTTGYFYYFLSKPHRLGRPAGVSQAPLAYISRYMPAATHYLASAKVDAVWPSARHPQPATLSAMILMLSHALTSAGEPCCAASARSRGPRAASGPGQRWNASCNRQAVQRFL